MKSSFNTATNKRQTQTHTHPNKFHWKNITKKLNTSELTSNKFNTLSLFKREMQTWMNGWMDGTIYYVCMYVCLYE